MPDPSTAVASAIREQRDGHVAIAHVAGADGRNVLSPEMREAIADAVERGDADPSVRCIVIAGGADAFAAGADIAALREQDLQEAMTTPGARLWSRLAACRTPLVAAVSGYALGGGCELALACDLVVASETAVFGQPEIRLGIIPGGGGTQRLARLAGKHVAMELVLTGRRFDANEAQRLGVVNRVVAEGRHVEAATELAQMIARRPPVAARLAKEAVLAAAEVPLSSGLALERRLYELSMATDDRVEGMSAFLDKRAPRFRGR